MPTNRKSESARINGAKSKGPITSEGKAKSSKNALRHGLTAEFAVLGHESEDDFRLLFDSYLDRYHPADAIEMELVHSMAIARWRLRRIGNLETDLFDNELAVSQDDIDDAFDEIGDQARFAFIFKKLAGESRALDLLIRYEASLNRAYDRASKQLDLLQSSRPLPNEPTRPLTRHSPPTSEREPRLTAPPAETSTTSPADRSSVRSLARPESSPSIDNRSDYRRQCA
jgi:hypothetical protein